MTTLGVIVCDGERFRFLDNGQLQRWTDNGWELLSNVVRDGVREQDDGFVTEDIRTGMLAAGRELHYLYGWRISEVNLYVTDEEMSETEAGAGSVENAPSFQDASVNFVKEQVSD